MNEDKFNMEIRKFLKNVGITSQREIEKATQQAIDSGKLQGDESLNARIVLEIPEIDLQSTIDGKISLE